MASDAAPDAGGDPNRPTFIALYHQAYRPMVSLARLMTGSNGAAEEVVQDAFVRMYRRYGEIDNPGAYLRISVVNGCRSWHRQRRRVRDHERRHAPGSLAEGCEADHDELLDALSVLSPRQRSAIVLRYYHDLSEAEIARLLSWRPGTVKSLLSRGLSRLKEVVDL